MGQEQPETERGVAVPPRKGLWTMRVRTPMELQLPKKENLRPRPNLNLKRMRRTMKTLRPAMAR